VRDRCGERFLLRIVIAFNRRNQLRFPVSDGGKTTEVTARIEAREKVTVPAGTFETVRVKAEPTTGGMKGRGTIWTWYTVDESRVPVQMQSKLAWGTLTFRLQEVKK